MNAEQSFPTSCLSQTPKKVSAFLALLSPLFPFFPGASAAAAENEVKRGVKGSDASARLAPEKNLIGKVGERRKDDDDMAPYQPRRQKKDGEEKKEAICTFGPTSGGEEVLKGKLLFFLSLNNGSLSSLSSSAPFPPLDDEAKRTLLFW